MAKRHSTVLPPRIEAEVQERAFRRAIKRNAMPKWAEHPKHKREFLRIYRRSAIKNHFASAYEKTSGFHHVDHIVPLAGENVCGLMVPWNLHIIFAVINLAKGTMIVEEWHKKMSDDGKMQPRSRTRKEQARE